MAQLSFALYEAHESGFSIDVLAQKLSLPTDFVMMRIEAARLCLLSLEAGV